MPTPKNLKKSNPTLQKNNLDLTTTPTQILNLKVSNLDLAKTGSSNIKGISLRSIIGVIVTTGRSPDSKDTSIP
jgi:hypothetical protein